jgi:hypothetical protein
MQQRLYRSGIAKFPELLGRGGAGQLIGVDQKIEKSLKVTALPCGDSVSSAHKRHGRSRR